MCCKGFGVHTPDMNDSEGEYDRACPTMQQTLLILALVHVQSWIESVLGVRYHHFFLKSVDLFLDDELPEFESLCFL